MICARTRARAERGSHTDVRQLVAACAAVAERRRDDGRSGREAARVDDEERVRRAARRDRAHVAGRGERQVADVGFCRAAVDDETRRRAAGDAPCSRVLAWLGAEPATERRAEGKRRRGTPVGLAAAQRARAGTCARTAAAVLAQDVEVVVDASDAIADDAPAPARAEVALEGAASRSCRRAGRRRGPAPGRRAAAPRHGPVAGCGWRSAREGGPPWTAAGSSPCRAGGSAPTAAASRCASRRAAPPASRRRLRARSAPSRTRRSGGARWRRIRIVRRRSSGPARRRRGAAR